MKLLFLLTAVAALAWAQIGTPYPGRAPRPQTGTGSGGGMPDKFPGSSRLPRLPGRKGSDTSKAKTQQKEKDQSVSELTVLVRRLDAKGVVVEAEDGRLITLLNDEQSKPLPADVVVGDWAAAVSFVDYKGRWYLREVSFERKGTKEERERAMAPIPPNVFEDAEQVTEPVPASGGGGAKTPEKAAEQATGKVPEKAPEPEPAAEITEPSTVRIVLDNTGDERPHLQRGKPPQRTASKKPDPPPVTTASIGNPARPSPPAPSPVTASVPVAAEEPAAATLPAVRPPNRGDDAFIIRARAVSAEFLNSLPNYLVRQLTTRYQSEFRSGFQPIDQIECDLIVENGAERYRDFKRHGKPMKENPSADGSWSAGEFRSLQSMILDRAGITFFNKTAVQFSGRPAQSYRFTVPRESSVWRLQAESQVYLPAYSGTLWLDNESARVLRIELEARGIPSTFPFNKAETAVDYEFVSLGSRKYLLPTQSAVLSCSTGSSSCSKNTIEFRNYKLFGAQSEVSFDDNTPAPAVAPAVARPAKPASKKK